MKTRLTARTLEIGVVQGWFSASELRRGAITPSYRDRSLLLLKRHPTIDFLIWPEASSPDTVSRSGLQKTAVDWWFSDGGGPFASRRIHVPVLLGTPYRYDRETLYNSALFVSPRGRELGRYDKQRLVPLGERSITLGGLNLPAAFPFAAGTEPRVIEWDEHRLLPLICVEDIFSRTVSEAVAKVEPSLLLSMTSDAWFSSSAARNLHFQLSRLRAIENGLPLLRVTNRGVSAWLDPLGRIVGRLPEGHAQAVLQLGGPMLPVARLPFDERWLTLLALFILLSLRP